MAQKIFKGAYKIEHMESSKLIELLKTFDKSETRQFGDFVNASYFNKNQEVKSLYAYLRKYMPHFPPKRIERSAVFGALYKDETYDDNQMRRLMSMLLKLAEEFIGIQKYKAAPGVASYYEMSSFVDRNLDKHYEYKFKQTERKLETSLFRNADYYYQKYLLADTLSQQVFKKKTRRYDKSLQDTSDYFDVYFLSKKLIYTCEMINRNKIISKAYTPQLLKEIKQFLKIYPLDTVPFIHVYYNILMMLTSEDATTYFQTLKSLLNKYEYCFSIDEKREMYGQALNYSIRMLNQGNQDYLKESFNLCKYGIEKGFLNDKGYLSPWGYKNVIKLGLMLNNFEWVKTFIETKTDNLEPNFRQNALHFNLADLYYSTKDFNKALLQLNQVEFSDIYLAIDSKILLKKIYFESNEFDSLSSALAAFKQFISRNKILSKSVTLKYKNYISALNLLTKGDHQSVIECRDYLESDVPIAERNWLRKMAHQ